MKSLRSILGFVLLGLAVFILIGLSLPSDWEAEAEAVIAAPPAEVYAKLAPLRAWQEWAVWFEHDPDIQVEYAGPESGVGAVCRWSGNPSVGSGEWRVAAEVPGQRLELRMSMNGGRFVAEGPIRVLPDGGGTRVKWSLRGDFGSDPFGRFNRRFLEEAVSATLQDSLDRLKARVESPAQ